MPFTGKTEYGKYVAAKLRSQLVIEGLFAHPFDGEATAAAVKIPVTADEAAGSYSRTNLASNSVSYDSNTYITLNMGDDLVVNKYIDGFDVATASYDEQLDALDRASYSLEKGMNAKGIATIVNGAQGYEADGTTAIGSTDARYSSTTNIVSVGSDDIYDALTTLAGKLTDAGVPMDGRYIVVNGTAYAKIMASNKVIRQGDLAQKYVEQGYIAQIAGFNVKVSNLVTGTAIGGTDAVYGVVGHPAFGANPTAFRYEPTIVDGNGDANVVGGAFVKGRVCSAFAVINVAAFGLLTA